MRKLIQPDGTIPFGIYTDPLEEINYREYALRTPMGIPVPGFAKKMKFNQFHFFGVIGPELMAGLAVVDLKLVTNGFFYIYDRQSRELVESKKLSLPNRKVFIKTDPSHTHSCFESGDFSISIQHNRISACGKDVALTAEIDLADADPLRICTRAGYRGWVYTQKTSPLKLTGELSFKGKTVAIASPDYMGLMDWTGGFMRRYTYWNWAATAATLPDGRPFGLNLASGVNETGFTENVFWLDGVRSKVSTVNFVFDQKDLYAPWRITSADGKLNLTFTPEAERSEKLHTGLIASRFTQLMGTLAGELVDESGERVRLENCPGWVEDHYAKW
jgi:hypothetical protein